MRAPLDIINSLDNISATGDSFGDSVVDSAWEERSACRDVSVASEIYFSEDLGDIAAAKRICAECPVLAECLSGALDRKEPWGVWGGQLFLNGRMVAQKRRRGRPPKVARPEDELPVVPIPSHLRELASTA